MSRVDADFAEVRGGRDEILELGRIEKNDELVVRIESREPANQFGDISSDPGKSARIHSSIDPDFHNLEKLKSEKQQNPSDDQPENEIENFDFRGIAERKAENREQSVSILNDRIREQNRKRNHPVRKKHHERDIWTGDRDEPDERGGEQNVNPVNIREKYFANQTAIENIRARKSSR